MRRFLFLLLPSEALHHAVMSGDSLFISKAGMGVSSRADIGRCHLGTCRLSLATPLHSESDLGLRCRSFDNFDPIPRLDAPIPRLDAPIPRLDAPIPRLDVSLKTRGEGCSAEVPVLWNARTRGRLR